MARALKKQIDLDFGNVDRNLSRLLKEYQVEIVNRGFDKYSAGFYFYYTVKKDSGRLNELLKNKDINFNVIGYAEDIQTIDIEGGEYLKLTIMYKRA